MTEPFPDALIRLLAPDRVQISVTLAAMQGKAIGFFAGRGDSSITIDLEAQTFTRQEAPNGRADHREDHPEDHDRQEAPAALPRQWASHAAEEVAT